MGDKAANKLMPDIVEQFVKDGYVVLEDFLSHETCDALFARLRTMIDNLDMETHPKSVFSTEHQKNDEYFMESQDKIRFFFEENVFDTNGKLNREKHLAVNKIGHGLHHADEEFKAVTHHLKMQELSKALDFIEPVVIQSMAIFKPPLVGGCVTPHQDGTFLITNPSKVIGIWIALEDADIENGCLWFIPGSQSEPTGRKMIRNPDGNNPVTIFTSPEDVYDDSKFVAVPVKKGSAVVIHGHVVHKSAKNLSNRSRGIYTFHIAETDKTEWSSQNWLQPTDKYSFPKLYTT